MSTRTIAPFACRVISTTYLAAIQNFAAVGNSIAPAASDAEVGRLRQRAISTWIDDAQAVSLARTILAALVACRIVRLQANSTLVESCT